MSDIEDDISDIEDIDYIDAEFNDDEDGVKKNEDSDNEDETYNDDDDIDEGILKKQFEIDKEDIEEEDNDLVYVVPSNERTTSEKLSEYEVAELINVRAVNISNGGTIYTDVKNLIDPIEMAKKELIDRRCPLYIKRQIGCNERGVLFIEKWSPNEMSFNVRLNN